MTRIPYPIPMPDRLPLIAAGKLAVESLQRDDIHRWRNRHAAVELILQQIMAKYGRECEE